MEHNPTEFIPHTIHYINQHHHGNIQQAQETITHALHYLTQIGHGLPPEITTQINNDFQALHTAQQTIQKIHNGEIRYTQ